MGQLYLALVSLLGSVLVETQPPGLLVWVDGQARGASPVHLILPSGTHTVRVTGGRRWGVQPVESLLVVGDEPVHLTLEAPSTLRVVHPPGALVLENGSPAGRVPLVLSRRPGGARSIEVVEGDQTYRWWWYPLPGATTTSWVTLPRPSAAPRPKPKPFLISGLALALAASSVAASLEADEAYRRYRSTANPDKARALFRRAERYDRLSWGLWAGFQVVVVGGTLWVLR